MVKILQTTTDNYPCPPSSITYNPKKEKIRLTGALNTVNIAMNSLHNLLKKVSMRYGRKYLATSYSGIEPEASTSRVHTFDNSSICTNCNLRKTRVFPIRAKEDRDMIGVWFEFILPILPRILEQPLGGTYSASLVRRGYLKATAKPCIQIESPWVPKREVQELIQDSLREICNEKCLETILFRFIQGSVKKLNGGEEGSNEGSGVSPDVLHRRYNIFRPSSKPAMGSSIGLLCCKKISGTLGGYIILGGDKFVLTSDHFVEESQMPANRDSDDKETITSPSRYDLRQMEGNMFQTKRDLESEIASHMKTLGDKQISEQDLSGTDPLSLQLRETQKKVEDVMKCLDQIKKPASEFSIGKVKHRSQEPRTVAIPRHLMRTSQLERGRQTLKHLMDWSLSKVDSGSGENRHKYRSNEDAAADNYIEEKDHADHPGELCHETCDPEIDAAVYYVGQGSNHRTGLVNVPVFVNWRNGDATQEWAIVSPKGEDLQSSDVRGDSGAWVIRQNDNKLMGQILAHDSGQLLFTPIKAIFDDIEHHTELAASLPRCCPDVGQNSASIYPTLLSAKPGSPLIQAYDFMKRPLDASITCPDKQPVAGTLELSPWGACPADTNEHGEQLCDLLRDSQSTPPSLTDSPQSPGTPDFLRSPGSLKGIQPQFGKAENKKPPSNTLIESEIPYWSLDEQDENQTSFTARTSTWPIDRKRKVVRMQRETRLAPKPQSQDYFAPASTLWVLDVSGWLARQNSMCTRCPQPGLISTLTDELQEGVRDFRPTNRPRAKRGISTSPILHDVSD